MCVQRSVKYIYKCTYIIDILPPPLYIFIIRAGVRKAVHIDYYNIYYFSYEIIYVKQMYIVRMYLIYLNVFVTIVSRHTTFIKIYHVYKIILF